MVETLPLCYGLILEANGTNWIFALSYSKFSLITQNVSVVGYFRCEIRRILIRTVFLEPRLKTEFTVEAKGPVELERFWLDLAFGPTIFEKR